MGYDTPDWIQMVQDAAVVLAFLTALVGAVIAIGRYLILRPLTRLIDERTKPIQPETNGGKSLSDVHRKLDDMADRICRIESEIVRIDEELEHIVE